jgi:transcriptional regulator with XRE-family HTH domain
MEETQKEIDDLYIRIGQNVKHYRELKNYTQLDLALALNFKSASAIAQPEQYYLKKHKFNIANLYLISKELDIPMEDLIK